jgi:hypothetical protein
MILPFSLSFPEHGKEYLLSHLMRERTYFEDAVLKSQFKGESDAKQKEIIKTVRDGLDEIEAHIAKIDKTALGNEYYSLLDKIQYLARLRAYVYPINELEGEATQAINDLIQWRVPDAVIGQIRAAKEAGMKKKNADEYDNPAIAQSALNKIYDEYDYWSLYVDWYLEDILPTWSARLTLGALLLFVTAIILFSPILHASSLIPVGFLFAAASGSCMSVLMKPPTISGYEEAEASSTLLFQRVLAGVAAAAIGYGLLATGILNIPLTNGSSLPIIICECGNSLGSTEKCGNNEDKTMGVDEQLGANPQKVSLKRADNCLSGCSLTARAVLFAIALAIGFSERALSSFENSIFSKFPDDKGGIKKNVA